MRVPTLRRRREITDEELSWTWQTASLLLGYPDEELLGRVDLLRQVCAALPSTLGEPLNRTLEHLTATPLTLLQEEYVETFDTRRRHNLFLTYFAHGDTRKRGVALLRFKQTYMRAGFDLRDDELPDHLCVVLEFAATIDRDEGRTLILDHRAGLELLRLALGEKGSPWAGAVAAVTATLPPLGDDERGAIARLAAEGPPEEEVGLTPYATPAFDPATAVPPPEAGPTALPMPTFPGAR
ncbi:Nitrate reductase-like protein NarX [Nocardioides dokdonensis FR1436]|uniref:Nitrate reductase-like protein NarX n=1 Tax=Nocardioides dokdonensis FR1436 TaxID=1300347 RepID=A0A1A9GRE9_9ACTN|nr:nitrate reductase molybdenum cofactor assembly chaperone [Nocardioides dokdonensis]ANH40035.1 Nitrate reductase-like protein NarX [Nocardioides dokdonensis FR1436]